MTGIEAAELQCLQCGQTRAQIKRCDTFCGIEGGYEYVELIAEWPRHRWAAWTDKELTLHGLVPEAFSKYRRHPITQFEYLPCEDTPTGHRPAKTYADQEWSGAKIGQCVDCGYIEGSDS